MNVDPSPSRGPAEPAPSPSRGPAEPAPSPSRGPAEPAPSPSRGPAEPAPRIVIACPNLSLDRTIRVRAAALGRIHRSLESDVRGGGKGANVARALRCMDRPSLVVGISCGRSGRAVADLMTDEGLTLVTIAGTGETRSCLTVLSDSAPTVFNDSGPPIEIATWSRYEETVVDHLEEGNFFLFSGSLPPGAPEDAAARLVTAARGTGCTTICDTSGEYLAAALGASPDIVKPNLHEALVLLGEEHDESVEVAADALERAADASLRLLEWGPRVVVVTAGAIGLVYATEDRTHIVTAPEIEVINPVGAGDCFVAGLALRLSQGAQLHEAIITGTAMAAASCETFAASILHAQRAKELRLSLAV